MQQTIDRRKETRFPIEVKYYFLLQSLQLGPGADTTSYRMSKGASFAGDKCRDIELITHLRLVPVLSICRVIIPLPNKILERQAKLTALALS
jgi:hypothetical protein